MPRIYLAIDNCFASKRWVHPADWARKVRQLGVGYVEASADNECDPLYSTPEALADWARQVRRLPEDRGVRVANLYSGHGTYATLGLGHRDPRIGKHILDDWIRPMVDLAAGVGAGLGFYTHAFSQDVLEDPAAYQRARAELIESLSQVSTYAAQRGLPSVGIEQMYTPHQIPWRFEDARSLLRDVHARSGHPLYLTLDAGHASGQRRFLMPTEEQIREHVAKAKHGARSFLYAGPQEAQEILERMAATGDLAPMNELLDRMRTAPHLFCHDPQEGDFYQWLERMGCYSPIVHLQQTDGHRSAHAPFTPEHNADGVVDPKRVLSAIAASYRRPIDETLPPRCSEIYLTLEIFASTACYPAKLLEELRQSVAYWRQVVHQDGLLLDTLLDASW
jgi:sugar phosphate isomerase/epimerase